MGKLENYSINHMEGLYSFSSAPGEDPALA